MGDSPAAAAAVTRLGWKLGAWRRKLGATRTRTRIRVQRGTTSSTLTSSLSSHRNAALSQICALNRIRASKAARVRRRETEAEGLKSDLTLPRDEKHKQAGEISAECSGVPGTQEAQIPVLGRHDP